MDRATWKLMTDYEEAFSTLDGRKQADLFADSFISAGPKGTIGQSREEFRKLADKAGDFYRSVGQTGAAILEMKETPISDAYSTVTIHWGVTFEKTGKKPVEFDVTYVVQKVDPAHAKIIMFIAHQDEGQAMKDLGLSPSRAA